MDALVTESLLGQDRAAAVEHVPAEPGPFGGFNLDWSPVAIALEAVGLVVPPYTNPFYSDALAPLVTQAFPEADLAALNAAAAPRLFITATNVVSAGQFPFRKRFTDRHERS